jgi:hypothetical protein
MWKSLGFVFPILNLRYKICEICLKAMVLSALLSWLEYLFLWCSSWRKWWNSVSSVTNSDGSCWPILAIILVINFSHHPWLALKVALLFLANYFVFYVISVVSGNPLFCKPLKYSKTGQCQDSPSPWPRRRHSICETWKELFLYFPNDVHMLQLLYTFYQLHNYLTLNAQNKFAF